MRCFSTLFVSHAQFLISTVSYPLILWKSCDLFLYRSLLPQVPIDYWSFSIDTFGCTKSSHSMLICLSITSSTTTTTTAQKQHRAALEWTTVPPEQRQSEPCPDGSQRDVSNPWRAPFSSSDTQPGICFETQLRSLQCTREKAFLKIYS